MLIRLSTVMTAARLPHTIAVLLLRDDASLARPPSANSRCGVGVPPPPSTSVSSSSMSDSLTDPAAEVARVSRRLDIERVNPKSKKKKKKKGEGRRPSIHVNARCHENRKIGPANGIPLP